ncbi:MAG: endo alpha-1,4 polygalactosaminidase [Geminicoccaceae bacterium]
MFKLRPWRPAPPVACPPLGLALGLAATLAMAGSAPADADRLPVIAHSPTNWTAQRWPDIRAPTVRPLLAARLDLCRDQGFDDVLLAYPDGYAHGSGFALIPAQQLEFDRWLAAAAHARSLAVGLVNDLGQAGDLAPAFDFMVAEGCMPAGGCGGVRPFLTAGKPVYLVAFTHQRQRMDAYGAAATAVAAPLIFKIQSLNGKLHRRCA